MHDLATAFAENRTNIAGLFVDTQAYDEDYIPQILKGCECNSELETFELVYGHDTASIACF